MSLSTADEIRVLLVNGQRLIRAGLRVLIEQQPDLTVVAEASNRHEILAVADCAIDVILLDPTFANGDGLMLVRDLRARVPDARIVLLAEEQNTAFQHQAIQQGVVGVVTKDASPEHLIKAIHKVHAGEIWLERSMIASILGALSSQPPAPPSQISNEQSWIASLTERQCEIIRLVGEGLKNRQIAERLFISEATVRHHLTSIFSKLHLRDRYELLMFGYKHGLITPRA